MTLRYHILASALSFDNYSWCDSNYIIYYINNYRVNYIIIQNHNIQNNLGERSQKRLVKKISPL